MTTATNGRAGRTKDGLKPIALVSDLAAQLQSLQRQRAIVLKSRNMQATRLQAIVAGTLGYHSSMPEKDRARKFTEASALIKAVAAGEADPPLKNVILVTLQGIDAFNGEKDVLEKQMVATAKQLPVAAWVKSPEQRGFGLLFLAIVIGETGNLANYPNPAKVWRRLGCAPWSFDGQTHMGATWRAGKEGKLPASEWEQFGYSPRRRSIAFLIGEGIVKQNGAAAGEEENGESKSETDVGSAPPPRLCGPYRQRYDEAKAAAHVAHPDWPPLRCHRHGMLLATKLLLKRLWIQWNPAMARV